MVGGKIIFSSAGERGTKANSFTCFAFNSKIIFDNREEQ
jgi:hypothetical protein